MNIEGVFPVLCTVDGGEAGGNGQSCSFTYTIATIDGVILAHERTPARGRWSGVEYAKPKPGSVGMGYRDVNGATQLMEVGAEVATRLPPRQSCKPAAPHSTPATATLPQRAPVAATIDARAPAEVTLFLVPRLLAVPGGSIVPDADPPAVAALHDYAPASWPYPVRVLVRPGTPAADVLAALELVAAAVRENYPELQGAVLNVQTAELVKAAIAAGKIGA